MKLKYLGHSALLAEAGGTGILIDPFLTGNPRAGAGAGELTPDYIVLTHGHADHIGDTVEIADRTGCTVVSTPEICTWLEERGAKTLMMNIGGPRSFGNFSLRFTPAWHSNSLPDGTYGGMPMGVVIEAAGKRIYHAGDTALFSDMQLIGSGLLFTVITGGFFPFIIGSVALAVIMLIYVGAGGLRTIAWVDALQYFLVFGGITLIGVSKNPESTLLRQSDIALVLPDAPEACAIGMAPTTSTTVSLALGDALAVAVMRIRGFGRDAFHLYHPGGKLGAQFLRVGAIMHKDEALPAVAEGTGMGEVLMQMSAKGFGVAALTDPEGRLSGVITDGDLRRNLDGLMERRAADVATRNPRSIAPDALVSEAVRQMNQSKVNALCVVEADGRLVGLVRLHDCLRAGVV